MNEELQAALVQYLEKFEAAVAAGADFAGEQIPLIIQEKLAFDFWMAWLYIGIGVVAALTCAGVWSLGSYMDTDEWEPGAILGGVVGLGIMVLFVIFNLPVILQISLAPRLYIIEWAASLVR